MPTHNDETLQQRYEREHREFERICEQGCNGCDDCTDDDGDLQTRYEMLQSWLAEADASNDRLKKHLSNTLEIAYTWQPGYATKMDRDTLALAAQAIGYEPPNTTDDTKPQEAA